MAPCLLHLLHDPVDCPRPDTVSAQLSLVDQGSTRARDPIADRPIDAAQGPIDKHVDPPIGYVHRPVAVATGCEQAVGHHSQQSHCSILT
jgi:hypothetical protein